MLCVTKNIRRFWKIWIIPAINIQTKNISTLFFIIFYKINAICWNDNTSTVRSNLWVTAELETFIWILESQRIGTLYVLVSKGVSLSLWQTRHQSRNSWLIMRGGVILIIRSRLWWKVATCSWQKCLSKISFVQSSTNFYFAWWNELRQDCLAIETSY